jgi:hypothetical protein
MILGTILESKPVRHTWGGAEYRVQWDKNPEAKSMDGRAGTALQGSALHGAFHQGDRVVLVYKTGPSYGLWFIDRKV